jgi:hypothetical protein
MSWTTPIYDRQRSDIEGLTSKAFFNAADRNRIEGNLEYLFTQYTTLTAKGIFKTDWAVTDIPYARDMDRIFINTKIINRQISHYILPDKIRPLTIWKLNAIEKCLQIAYDRITRMTVDSNYAGEFYSGEIGAM